MKHLTITVSRFTGLFVSAALLFVPVSATWGCDTADSWKFGLVRTDGGEPKIYCSQQVAYDDKSAVLTYCTSPNVDSPPAKLVYDCRDTEDTISPIDRIKNHITVIPWHAKCTVRNGTVGGTYQLNGSSVATLHYLSRRDGLCDDGYRLLGIWAKKK